MGAAGIREEAAILRFTVVGTKTPVEIYLIDTFDQKTWFGFDPRDMKFKVIRLTYPGDPQDEPTDQTATTH